MKTLLIASAGLVVGSLPATAATLLRTTSMAAGTILDGDSTTLVFDPNYTADEIANASELRISFVVTGASHMLTESLTPFGMQHIAELLTQVSFTQGSTIDIMSPQQLVFDARPFISGLDSIDSTEGLDTTMNYSTEFMTTDPAVILSLAGGMNSFEATPQHELGADSQFARDFGGITDFSNQRMEDSVFQVQFQLTTVPEPSSTVLILLSGIVATCFRRRA